MVSETTSQSLRAGPAIRAQLRSAVGPARCATVSAALAPLAMIGAWLVAEALQPPSYSPLRSSISGLAAIGATDRWIVTSALILAGACYFVTACCLPQQRAPSRLVLAIAGLSSIGIAVSPQPAAGTNPQHLVWTSLGAVAITIWPAFTASRAASPPPVLTSRGAATVTAVFLVLLVGLIAETQHGTALGLAERLVTGVQMAWAFVVALALRRGPGDASTAAPQAVAVPARRRCPRC